MATKLGRMVTYFDYLLPIKSNNHIITRFCETIGQPKTYSHYHNANGHKTWQDAELH